MGFLISAHLLKILLHFKGSMSKAPFSLIARGKWSGICCENLFILGASKNLIARKAAFFINCLRLD